MRYWIDRQGDDHVQKFGLAPLIPAGCRLLILGSLPGDRSLAAQQYYAHPRNQFWALLEAVSGRPLSSMRYADRLSALTALRVGLWDVLASARRKTSLDSDIRDAVPNALETMLRSVPDCQTIGCNGARSAQMVRAQIDDRDWKIVDLPSSSAAYTKPFNAKLEHWMQLRPLLIG